jgi:hypothetical protein
MNGPDKQGKSVELKKCTDPTFNICTTELKLTCCNSNSLKKHRVVVFHETNPALNLKQYKCNCMHQHIVHTNNLNEHYPYYLVCVEKKAVFPIQYTSSNYEQWFVSINYTFNRLCLVDISLKTYKCDKIANIKQLYNKLRLVINIEDIIKYIILQLLENCAKI